MTFILSWLITALHYTHKAHPHPAGSAPSSPKTAPSVTHTSGQTSKTIITQNCASSNTWNSLSTTPLLLDLSLPPVKTYSPTHPDLLSLHFPPDHQFAPVFTSFSIPETMGSINDFPVNTFYSLASLSFCCTAQQNPQSWRIPSDCRLHS